MELILYQLDYDIRPRPKPPQGKRIIGGAIPEANTLAAGSLEENDAEEAVVITISSASACERSGL